MSEEQWHQLKRKLAALGERCRRLAARVKELEARSAPDAKTDAPAAEALQAKLDHAQQRLGETIEKIDKQDGTDV